MKISRLAFMLSLLVGACASPARPQAATGLVPTRVPTASPMPLPTLSPTLQATSPARSATAAPVLSCTLNWQFPLNGTKVEPREDFTVRWNITNTGNVAWEPGVVDFEYVGGTPMHFSPVLSLPQSVAPGQSITLSVDMKTHRDTRHTTSSWALSNGEMYFCTLTILIHVQWVIDNEQF